MKEWRLAAIWIGVIGLILAAATLGHDVGSRAADERLASAADRIAALERELAERPTPQPAPSAPDDPIPPDDPTPPTATGSVARQDTLDLTVGNSWDLDNWRSDGLRDIDLVDYYYTPPRAGYGNSNARLVSVEAAPSFETCTQTEAFAATPIDLQVGSHLCVRTSDEALAGLTVTKIEGSGSASRVTFSVTVWQS